MVAAKRAVKRIGYMPSQADVLELAAYVILAMLRKAYIPRSQVA
jgi:hypothetical protein